MPLVRRSIAFAILTVLSLPLASSIHAQDSRVSPLVKAVQKVKPSVVCIKIPSESRHLKDVIGTGLIIDERGYIVTNRHVVAGKERVQVILVDKTELTGTVIVSDENTDLAIIRVEAGKKLPAQVLAPAADLLEGEEVVAVGHPFGYAFTVTRGIVSALDRKIDMPTGATLAGLIQTDAAINPGNSGGPLLNIHGEVIGINVALREGAQGIAFAINTDTVKRVLRQHLSAQKVAGVTHGLETQDQVAEEGQRQRVIVAEATVADVKRGDVILCVGQMDVRNGFDLERALWDARPGQSVTVRVRRGEQELTVQLPLGAVAGKR